MTVTTSELTALTGTELTEATLNTIISTAQSEVTTMLNLFGISTYDSTDFDNAVKKIAVALIIQRHKLDGTMPDNLSIGGINVSHNPDGAIKILYDQALNIVQKIALKNAGFRQIFRRVN